MRARLAVQRETSQGALRYEGLLQAFRRMHAAHGLFNFYRGVGITLAGILPYAAISFTTFETAKHYVADRTGEEPSTAARLACGGLAGLAGQVTTYPLDIVRRRMQTEGFSPIHAHAIAVFDSGNGGNSNSNHNGNGSNSAASAASAALSSRDSSGASAAAPAGNTANSSPAISSARGGIGVASGTGPPSKPSAAASRTPLYSSAPLRGGIPVVPPPSPMARLVARAAGARFATGYEFETHRLSAAATLRHVVATDGVKGLFKGFTMNILKGPLGVGISFTTYDFLKKLWGIERR